MNWSERQPVTTLEERFRLSQLAAVPHQAELFHISHFSDAKKIIEEKAVKTSAVQDHSTLRDRGVDVCWLAFKKFKHSFYGSVKFVFDTDELFSGKDFYWIEYIEYNPIAPRFLVCPPNYDVGNLPPNAQKLNIAEEGSPIRKVDTGWKFPFMFNCEFMLTDPVSLALCKRIETLRHMPDEQGESFRKPYCSKYKNKDCDESDRADLSFIGLLAHCLLTGDDLLKKLFKEHAFAAHDMFVTMISDSLPEEPAGATRERLLEGLSKVHDADLDGTINLFNHFGNQAELKELLTKEVDDCFDI